MYVNQLNASWHAYNDVSSIFTQGLQYIHGTNIGSHGHLRSSTCLIDSRWQIKLTSIGLSFLKDGESTDSEKGDYQIYKKLLWTAPELLRQPECERPPNGTLKGDIYSFGIVLQELIYRAMPFFMDLLSPKGYFLINIHHFFDTSTISTPTKKLSIIQCGNNKYF